MVGETLLNCIIVLDLKKKKSTSCTPLLVLDTEMDRGAALIYESVSRTNSGPVEVVPDFYVFVPHLF